MKLVKSKCNTLMATSEVLHESNVIYVAPNHKRTSVRTTTVREAACSTACYGSEHLPTIPRTDVEGLRREQLIGADLGSRQASSSSRLLGPVQTKEKPFQHNKSY